MSSSTPGARGLVVRHLKEQLARNGSLPTSAILSAAQGLGVHPRTIRRYVFDGRMPTGARPRYVATQNDIEAFFENNGHYQRSYKQRQKEDASLPSRRTWERAINRALRPGTRAFAKEGEAGRRRHQLYLKWEPEARNEVWEVDHKVLDVWVLPDHRSTTRVQPGVILFVDGRTRAIMGYTLSLTHTTDDVLAALRHAILPDPDIGPFHGVPKIMRFDNGLEFLASGFTDALRTVGTHPWAADPYTPYHKGKVERLNRTISEEFCATLPGASATPRTANPKRFYGPNAKPLDMRTLAPLLRIWVARYNTERPHSSLDGGTPKETWESDPTPLQTCSEAELRWLRKRRQLRHIGKDGIHFQSLIFTAPELQGLVGEEVEVAYETSDLREIDVYREGEFLCMARPRETLSADERLAFLAARKEAGRRSSNARRKASNRQRLKYAAAGLTTPVVLGGKRDIHGKPRPQRKLTAPTGGRVSDLLGLDKYLKEGESGDA